MKPLVYIAGPITKGCQFTNVAKACDLWDLLMSMGIDAYCPHWSALQQIRKGQTYQQWMDYDKRVILPRCQAVFRMEGESNGGDEEVAWARENLRPVFFDIPKLAEWYETYDRKSDLFGILRTS